MQLQLRRDEFKRRLAEATLKHRDDPTWIDLRGYSNADLAQWTFVENCLSPRQASEQSKALARLGILASSFTKGTERWHITYAVPPDVSLVGTSL